MVEVHSLGRHTVDDIPDDEGTWELVDGVLTLSPAPLWGHSRVVSRLHDVLRPAVPDEFWVVSDTGISPERFEYRVPDLMVVRPGEHPDDGVLDPHDVVLAVEVVSESSVTNDRILKPALYARWGIEAFWNMERDPDLTLTAYVLEPGAAAYTEVGTWREDETVTLELPFVVSFPLADLLR